ncbi:MAG: glucose-1-phosphate adenylyltransferase [Clostridiales bacterium]|nr:glucose-1-phosphate adenylyltransferase [Clostridiales bacterium]
MGKKEIVAMILAGGQGTRLGVLTKNTAKPAVPFGGKYRIIDFPLSNCSNSGIDTVGVLTQYKPLELNEHIGEGSAWDLDIRDGGVSILPPYQNENGGNWYKGTANAIYQNIEYIDRYSPEYILVLSGDHIYKMDYAKMLKFHKEKEAVGTIAVIEVPLEEANRFGIMNTREDLSIADFEEKPQEPKGNLASMGIYIFNWAILKKYLKEDEEDVFSQNDFGKNIIPKMIDDKIRMVAYPFKGYWKDVGTINSFWEANMDLLKGKEKIDIYDNSWNIFSNNQNVHSQYIGKKAVVKNSLISDGCSVEGKVINSILSRGVEIGKNTIVMDSVIMPNAKIGDNIVINKAIITDSAMIKNNTKIGDGERVTVFSSKEEVKSGCYNIEACNTI